jgi:hypothetical protein
MRQTNPVKIEAAGLADSTVPFYSSAPYELVFIPQVLWLTNRFKRSRLPFMWGSLKLAPIMHANVSKWASLSKFKINVF